MITNQDIDTVRSDILIGVIGKMDYLSLYYNDEIQDKENIALICILEPNVNNHPNEKIEGFHDVIQTKFWDITEPRIKHGETYPCITKEQGLELKEFILKNKDKKFLVHCAAGKSRSAGTALAIECLVKYNGDLLEFNTSYSAVKSHTSNRYSPNLLVRDTILGLV